MKFIEAVGQFERIMNDSGFITLTRLAVPEITGQDGKAGIIEKYFSLSQTDTTCLKDIGLYPEEMRVGDDILCLHTLSDVEDLPEKSVRTHGLKSCPPTGATAACHSPPRWACCCRATTSITNTSS